MKKVKAYVAISPFYEGSNIYLPSGIMTMPIYENIDYARLDGWDIAEIVECVISYKPRKKK